MDPREFPKTTQTRSFLRLLRGGTDLKELPRLIKSGRTRRNGTEFVVGRPEIEEFLDPELLRRAGGATVELFALDINVQQQRLQLTRDAADNAQYIFRGGIISDNQNEEIQLWGYPKHRRDGILVLTVGVPLQ